MDEVLKLVTQVERYASSLREMLADPMYKSRIEAAAAASDRWSWELLPLLNNASRSLEASIDVVTDLVPAEVRQAALLVELDLLKQQLADQGVDVEQLLKSRHPIAP